MTDATAIRQGSIGSRVGAGRPGAWARAIVGGVVRQTVPMALRFGLFGTGYWAAETQAAALAIHPEAEFVGVWGRDPAKAKALADRYAVGAYDEVDALLRDVQAVAVALPPAVQAELAVRAAAAGCHLLLDKPLALDTASADRVVAAVRDNGLASQVFFTNRFYSNVRRFLDEAAGSGPWLGARVTFFASIFQPGSPYEGSLWRREKGGLWDVGPHGLSLVAPVLGPVTQVAAMDGACGAVYLLLGHRDGGTTTMSLALDAPQRATSFDVSFFGEPGLVAVPDGDGTPTQAFGAAIGRLAANAASGTVRDPLDVGFGREVIAVLEAAERARTEGITVTIEPGED